MLDGKVPVDLGALPKRAQQEVRMRGEGHAIARAHPVSRQMTQRCPQDPVRFAASVHSDREVVPPASRNDLVGPDASAHRCASVAEHAAHHDALRALQDGQALRGKDTYLRGDVVSDQRPVAYSRSQCIPGQFVVAGANDRDVAFRVHIASTGLKRRTRSSGSVRTVLSCCAQQCASKG